MTEEEEEEEEKEEEEKEEEKGNDDRFGDGEIVLPPLKVRREGNRRRAAAFVFALVFALPHDLLMTRITIRGRANASDRITDTSDNRTMNSY